MPYAGTAFTCAISASHPTRSPDTLTQQCLWPGSIARQVGLRVNLRLRLRDTWRRVLMRLGVDLRLCRTCRYNNPRDCRHAKRPHALECEDYVRRPGD